MSSTWRLLLSSLHCGSFVFVQSYQPAGVLYAGTGEDNHIHGLSWGKGEEKQQQQTIQIVFELLSSFTRENLFQGQSTHLTYLFYFICFRYDLY